MKRREFLMKGAAIGMAAPLVTPALSRMVGSASPSAKTENTICTFSKPFQWLDYDELAVFLSDAGFDGIDLSVRPGGHVIPENIERDLPKAIEAAQKKGLTIPMMVTAITDAEDPATVRILKTASENGVRYYRIGYYRYDKKLSIIQNLDTVKRKLANLCELNAKFGIHGAYQNHVGENIGSPVWDLWYLIKDFDHRYIGCQYDVRHAMAEGMNSWTLGYKAVAPYVRHECIKDYTYIKDIKGKWTAKSVPLGTGVIDWKIYFSMRNEFGINGPLSIHYEFDLDGDDGALTNKERMKNILPAVRKEVETIRILMK